MIEINQCPVCGESSFNPLVACKDYTVSLSTFHVKQCLSCTLGITSPRPNDDKLPVYYQSEEYISHSGKSSGGIGKLYTLVRKFALKSKRNLVVQYQPSGSVLDLGCGTGEFLYTMQNSGWNVSGVEPSAIGREKTQTLIKKSVPQNIEQINNQQFETITAWHVLEHISELDQTLSKLKTLLKKDGTIFIAVPNYESYDGQLYKNFWAAYDVPRHLWHFSKKSMQHLLRKNGFKLMDIKPMKLDSYYISLLSEKYKNNNQLTISCLPKAFLSGLKSNFQASKATNYSSLIYIASHAN